MAANPTPTNVPQLFAACEKLESGCSAIATELGLQKVTAEILRVAINTARSALAEVDRLKAELGQRRAELRKLDREGEIALGRCRLRLVAVFGPMFNADWAAAGFPDESTMVPEVFAKRLDLLEKLIAYFDDTSGHASHDMGATAAVCASIHDRLSRARTAVDQTQAKLSAAVVAKDETLRILRQLMRELIWELGDVLSDDDARWSIFGLNTPASEPMPDPVASLTAQSMGDGKVGLLWPVATHATRYLVQLRELGAAEFSTVATTEQPSASLASLEIGRFIELRIIAANADHEAAASPIAALAVS